MGLFDIDFSKMGNALLPPDKRMPLQKAWVKAILSPLQWVRDTLFGDYKNGATYPPYSALSNYMKYERVIFRYSVYESLVDNNAGNDPLDVNNWMLTQENFIGIEERIRYNGHVIELTNALNRYFGTTFRQPPNLSDIYLEANAKPLAVFIVGGTEGNSSVIYRNRSSEFIINSYTFAGFVNLSINVPVAVYNALDTDPNNREQIIRNFADRYIAAGITYQVNTY